MNVTKWSPFGRSFNVTENSSKDCSKTIVAEAHGITNVEVFGQWIDNWAAYGGPTDVLDGTWMVVNKSTGRFQIWTEEVFDER
jgi:hypothetical protein